MVSAAYHLHVPERGTAHRFHVHGRLYFIASLSRVLRLSIYQNIHCIIETSFATLKLIFIDSCRPRHQQSLCKTHVSNTSPKRDGQAPGRPGGAGRDFAGSRAGALLKPRKRTPWSATKAIPRSPSRPLVRSRTASSSPSSRTWP